MKNVHVRYIGVTEGKNENLKKKAKSVLASFFIHTIHLA